MSTVTSKCTPIEPVFQPIEIAITIDNLGDLRALFALGNSCSINSALRLAFQSDIARKIKDEIATYPQAVTSSNQYSCFFTALRAEVND